MSVCAFSLMLAVLGSSLISGKMMSLKGFTPMSLITERPTYRPMPSAQAEAKKLVGVAVLGASVVLSEHEHLHVDSYIPAPPASHFDDMQDVGTSHQDVPFIGGYDGASDVVIRNQHARRPAFAR